MRAMLVAATLAAGCVLQIDDSEARLTIHNQSSRVITEVRLGDTWGNWWGPNLLWGDLAPGGVLMSGHVVCGDFDIQVTDAAGNRCTVDRLRLCWDDREWFLSDAMMAGCGP